VRRAAATVRLPNLGVAVYEGNVYQHGADRGGPASDRFAWGERRERIQTRLLGPLAGSQATLVSGRIGHRRSGGERVADAVLASAALHSPVGLVAGAFSRPGHGAIAIVTFPGGGLWQKTLTDSASVVRAQAEAVRFNAIVAAVSGQADKSVKDPVPARGGAGIADELERLAALHNSGALDDEEFRAAKARILAPDGEVTGS